MDENVRQIDFDVDNNDNKKYKVEAISNSAVYAKELKLDYLLRLYYLVFWKSYLKEENTWELASAI